MKICPNCHNQLDDAAMFCSNCGAQFAAAQPNPYQQAPNYGQPPYGYAPAPAYDPYDHTDEFDPKDISENKVVCMLIYLAGWIGMLVALLLAGTSKYVGYHLRQALKFQVVSLLIPIVLAVSAIINIIPFLGWIVYGLLALALGVFSIVIVVLQIICFFQICKGKAKEPAIIRNLKFMN